MLTLIALPIFFHKQAVCASKQTIARHIVGTIVRAQEAHHRERGEFMSSMQQVEQELGRFQNEYWQISMEQQENVIFVYATARPEAVDNLKRYSYVASITFDETSNQYLKIVCRTTEPTTTQSNKPILQEEQNFLFGHRDRQLDCASGTDGC
ncbi:MAG: type IV pilin-like G/H family protein [Oculatellaceae cyanobacterium bins.114]|nr:type IV pilin-like G/H family protein [Oculatellaceae cyanobacterium bins.114]